MFWIPLFSAFVFWEKNHNSPLPTFVWICNFSCFLVINLIFFHFLAVESEVRKKHMLTRWTELCIEISERLECPIVEWSNKVFSLNFWICPKKSTGMFPATPPKKNSCTLVEKKIRMGFSKVAFSGSAVRMISPWGWSWGVIPKLDGHYPGRKDLAQFHDVWWDPQLSWQVDISSKSKEKVKARETQCIKDRICVPWRAIDGCWMLV